MQKTDALVDHEPLPAETIWARIRAQIARMVIARASRRLAFAVVESTEEQVKFGGNEKVPTIRLNRPRDFYLRVGSGGLVGFGESYQARDWDADDVAHIIEIIARGADIFVPPVLQRFRDNRVVRRRRLETVETVDAARRNAHHHYDLPYTMFAQFLDETMTYSSALFEVDEAGRPLPRQDRLADAQRRKVDRILDLAKVSEGTSLLEVGTGWGELAIRAASRGAVVRSITNSAEQAAIARKRVARAGYAERVHIDLCDYRDLTAGPERYDAIVSVEMIEAVGERYLPTYFNILDRLLSPEGRIAIQVITMRHDRMLRSRNNHTWIHKYIFPGGLIPSVETIEEALGHSTPLRILEQYNFGTHYAATLRLWRSSFERNWPLIANQDFDDMFKRTWLFYLAYCEGGFAARYLDVYQFLIGSDNTPRPD